MLNLSAYYKKDMEALEDTQNDIVVNSIGHYRLFTRKRMVTNRAEGREDYQFVYVAKGAGNFFLNGQYRHVAEGSLVYFEPESPQVYEYCLEDRPDIYWIHFTGGRVKTLMDSCGFTDTGVYPVGVHSTYTTCFQTILQEMQVMREGFVQIAALEFCRLCYTAKRNMLEDGSPSEKRSREMEQAIQYFHQSYQTDISIENYARSSNMSVCWFIRRFKEYTGMTPQKFITDLRITKARELLQNRSFSVGEVAELVGYANPLYFSRIFKQYTGVMPSRYGKPAFIPDNLTAETNIQT